jgi:mitotic spindle assembly checkpoint protein MAD1
MILRTPPQRKRRADADGDADADLVFKSGGGASRAGWSPVSDRRLVLYDRPTALVPAGAPGEQFDDMVCTYHCRQMVRSLRPFLVLLWFS